MSVIAPPLEHLPATGLLIGDQRVSDAEGGTFEHRYPGSGEVTAEIPLAGPAEIDLAVRTARAAQPGWAAMPGPARRAILLKLADLIERDADLLSHLSTIDNGTPRAITGQVAPGTAELFRYNAGWTDRIEGTVVPTWPTDALDYAVRQAYGVVAIIIPWNGPLVSIGMTASPALAAGNAVIIKPPELTPYTALRLGELALEAGLPPGVFNVVPGGPVGGDALVRHPGVDKVHFTGSGATAKHILTAAMDNLTPVGLELGGKSANLIFDDIDVASSIPHLIWGLITLSGQGCINPTRLLVQEGVYDEVVATVTAVMQQIKMGDPYDPTTMMGPVINEAAAQRILGMIERSTEDGARITTGGNRMGGDLAGGYFIEPTIVADVQNSSYIAQNEVFGPILSILRFKDEDEAVRLANDSPFGLAAYIETNDLRRTHRVAAKLEAGNVWVNGFTGIPVSAPFGGWKASGHGRLGGRWGIEEFTQLKNVWIGLGDASFV